MTGRESIQENNIFFVCSLIEHIGRKTKNHRSVIVNALGEKKLHHLLELADIYHSENIEKISAELINKHNIESGFFDNVAETKYTIPSIWDIGKVYKRLIVNIIENRKTHDTVDVIIEVYNSWISRKIENFNSSMYFENPDYIFQSFLAGDVLV